MDQTHRKAMDFAKEASLGLPGSIKDVADYLLSEGSGIEFQTMAQVAAHTYVSKPTLVRFAKMAGYAGWTAYRHDFLVAVREDESELARLARVDVNHPFGDGTAQRDVARALAQIQRLAANEVERCVDPAVLEASARAILQARAVVFLGVMQNRHRGGVFASNLTIMGVPCQAPSPDEADPLVASLRAGDCVVATSYSGDVRHPPLDLVPLLRERGVHVIAVTNAGGGSLASLADHVLGFPPHEHLHDKVGAFYSGACTSLILDLLYASCFSLSYEKSGSSRMRALTESGEHVPKDFS